MSESITQSACSAKGARVFQSGVEDAKVAQGRRRADVQVAEGGSPEALCAGGETWTDLAPSAVGLDSPTPMGEGAALGNTEVICVQNHSEDTKRLVELMYGRRAVAHRLAWIERENKRQALVAERCPVDASDATRWAVYVRTRSEVRQPSWAFCGGVFAEAGAGADDPRSAVDVLGGDGRVPHYGNVHVCGNAWCCPVCAPVVRWKRSEELGKALTDWYASSPERDAVFITLTIRHTLADSLEHEFDVFSAAWRGVTSGRWWQDFRRDTGIVGFVRAVDITWSPVNGWHLHMHMLGFRDKAKAQHIKRDLGQLPERWFKKVAESYPENKPSIEHGCVIEECRRSFERDGKRYEGGDAVAFYINKLGSMAAEIARTDTKSARGAESLMPFQLLDGPVPALDANLSRKHQLFLEYAHATKGRSALQYSRGLRAFLGLGEMEDDEAVAEEASKEGDVLFRIAADVYDHLRHEGGDGALGHVLAMAVDSSVYDIADYITDTVADDHFHCWVAYTERDDKKVAVLVDDSRARSVMVRVRGVDVRIRYLATGRSGVCEKVPITFEAPAPVFVDAVVSGEDIVPVINLELGENDDIDFDGIDDFGTWETPVS
jgi:hypothetical protein